MAVIELLTFRLLADADETEFVAADAIVQTDFAYQQPGLVRRTLARDADGAWLALSVWFDDATADAAWAARATSPAIATAESFIDASSNQRARYEDLPG